MLLAATHACSDDARSLTREGSKPVDGAVSFTDAAISYRVTYRVRTAAGDEVTESTETITARRPFRSNVEVRGANGSLVRRVGRFGVLVLVGEGSARVLAVPPALGTSDVRPDATLDDAVDRDLAERREVREVGGRRCRVYRLGSTASDGTLVPPGSSGTEHADLCVDRHGLVLEEWWVRDGRPLRQRLAVAVDQDAEIDDAEFVIASEGSPGPTDGRVTEVETSAGQLLPSPSGWRRLGQFEVTPAQLQQPGSSEPPPPRTTIVDVWTRGADFLALDHGAGQLPASPNGIAVDIAGIGPAELVLDLRANELRFTTPAGDTARLYGTVAPSDLVDILTSLRRALTT